MSTFERARLELRRATLLKHHDRADRIGQRDASKKASNMLVVPHPASLKVWQLGFSRADAAEKVEKRLFRAVECRQCIHDSLTLLARRSIGPSWQCRGPKST